MKSLRVALILSVIAALGILTLEGCGQQSDVPPTGTADTADEAATTAIPPVLLAYKETIQTLPEAEWAAVYKQVTCPVTDQPLGSMGTPIKVTVEGRDVYICCEGCRKSLTDDPEKYLAKLPK